LLFIQNSSALCTKTKLINALCTETKVVNSVLFRPEWPKHSIPIQKTEQISSHFQSQSVPDFSAKFRPERSGFIPHVPFRS
jgi:hypothetical protein